MFLLTHLGGGVTRGSRCWELPPSWILLQGDRAGRWVNGAGGAVNPGRFHSQRGRGSLSFVSQLLMLQRHFFTRLHV